MLKNIFLIAVIICGIFSGFWLWDTFTAESYEYGDLSEVSSNLVFIIQTETMVFPTGTTEIKKEFESIYQVYAEFDAEENDYSVTLNSNPIPNSKIENGTIEMNLDLTFLNPDGTDKFSDELLFKIEFFSNKTIMTIETLNSDAVSFWNTYFNSYGFDLRVYKNMEVV